MTRMHSRPLLALVLALAWGCTPGGAVGPDDGSDRGPVTDGDPAPDDGDLPDGDPADGATIDGGPDAAAGDGMPPDRGPSMCEAPEQLCDGACVDVRTDRAYCGDCETRCDGGETCRDSVCVVDDCPAGTHDCDGTCVADDDPLTCGDRCAPCPAPDGGEATCVDGACAERCPADALACDGACAPCAADPADSACDGAACVCVPACGLRVCGADPACGESCGTCDDGDDVCSDGQCLGRCLTPLDGMLMVDVPTVAVAVEVTLDGAALTPDNTHPGEYGAVILRDPDSGEDVFRFPAIDAEGNFLLPYTARVVAGRYDVAYARVAYVNDAGGENHWPVNDDRILIRGLDIDDDGPLVIDVPTVAAPLDVTLDGAATDESNTSPADRGGVWLMDPITGEDVFGLSVMGDDGTFFLPWAPRVVAGEYRLQYRRGSYVNSPVGENNWPVNDQRDLGTIVLDDDGARMLDVPTVAPPLDVTLDGAATDESNTSPADRGGVWLMDPTTGEDVFGLSVMGDDGTLFLPWAPRVVAGEYRLQYRRGNYVNSPVGENNWPVNDQRDLGSVMLDDDGARAFDVPTAAPLLDVTLDGEGTDEGNTSPADRGGVWLMDPITGEDVFGLSVMGDAGELFLPWAPRVVAGEYRLQYRRGNYINSPVGANNWPVNDQRNLGLVLIEDDMPRNLDVATVAPPLDVTLDGEATDEANTTPADRGGIWLIDPETGEDVFSLTVMDNAGQLLLPWAPRVVAGEYVMQYRRQNYVNDRDAPGRWPVNDQRNLGRITLDDGAPRDMDVPSAIMRTEVTLDGAALTPDDTNDAESGRVIIRDRETGEDVFNYPTFADGAFLLPYSARVVAGRYGAHYARDAYRNINGDENHWPVNDDRPLICVEVP